MHQEALLKAQLFELRRDLAESQQKAQSAQQDLQKRQSLIKAAAGDHTEKRTALRKHAIMFPSLDGRPVVP